METLVEKVQHLSRKKILKDRQEIIAEAPATNKAEESKPTSSLKKQKMTTVKSSVEENSLNARNVVPCWLLKGIFDT